MLNTRLRKQIEWHFYNYKADCSLYKEKVQSVIDSGLTVDFGRVGSGSGHSNPTESKAILLETLEQEKNWATVIRNTFNAFRFEPEYEIMVALYIEGKKYNELFSGGLNESTFWYWRDRWLEHAAMWAKEFNLL